MAGRDDTFEGQRQLLKALEKCQSLLEKKKRIYADRLRGWYCKKVVLPNDVASSMEVFKFIAEEISINTYINIMD